MILTRFFKGDLFLMLNEVFTWLADLAATAVGNLLKAIPVLVIGLLVIRIVMTLVKKTLEKSRLNQDAHTLILSLIRAVLYVLLALMVASTLGIDVTGVVALASVLTLAVSLSLQNALTNVMGGFTLLSTHPFRSGDYVEVAGQSGTVQDISMTYTKLITPDNKVVSIPNSAVVAAQIVNYSAQDTRRVEVCVSASYDTPTQKVLDALVLAGTVDNALLEPAPVAYITGYGDSAINYSLRIWVKTADYWDVYFLVNQRVKQIFDEQGVIMTYPHLNVHMIQ